MPLAACCDLCDSRTPDYPRTEAILKQYVLDKLARNEPFYISAELNSDVVKPEPGFGLAFLLPLVAAAASVATTVAPLVGVAGAIKTITDGRPSSGQQSATIASQNSSGSLTVDQNFAAQVQADLAAKGINLPSSISGQVINASVLDLFGPGSSQWVILGGFALLLLVMTMRR